MDLVTHVWVAAEGRRGTHVALGLGFGGFYGPSRRATEGERDGGALSAGSFLAHFAKDKLFVYLDVAGTAMLAKPRLWYGSNARLGGPCLMADLTGSWKG